MSSHVLLTALLISKLMDAYDQNKTDGSVGTPYYSTQPYSPTVVPPPNSTSTVVYSMQAEPEHGISTTNLVCRLRV